MTRASTSKLQSSLAQIDREIRELKAHSNRVRRQLAGIERQVPKPKAAFRPTKKTGKCHPNDFIGMLTDAEADAMLKAIEESCEQVEPDRTW